MCLSSSRVGSAGPSGWLFRTWGYVHAPFLFQAWTQEEREPKKFIHCLVFAAWGTYQQDDFGQLTLPLWPSVPHFLHESIVAFADSSTCHPCGSFLSGSAAPRCQKVLTMTFVKIHPDKAIAYICTGIHNFIICLYQLQPFALTLVKTLIISGSWLCLPSLRVK